MNCYDFPELVVHATDGTCPRYNGGICFPLPTPVPPYTAEEEAAVQGYLNFMSGEVKITRIFHATGATIFPGKEGKA